MAASGRPLRIMIITGSTRLASHTRAAAKYAANHIIENGNEAMLWDLRRLPVPIANPEYHKKPSDNPDPVVRSLVTAASRADGFILATPVYHGSFSGVLKNALDHLTIAEFFGKPVGLISNGPRMTAIQACDQLRIVVRGLYGLCVPDQVVTTPEDFSAGENDSPVLADDDVQARIGRMIGVILKLARR
jgi:azobenzene reductase